MDDLTSATPLPGAGKREFSAGLSQKRLRALLRASPLISPDLRAHWLRVLPHLTADQRAELAQLLESRAGDAAPQSDGSRA